MLYSRRVLQSLPILVIFSLFPLAWAPGALAQLDDHDACGNTDPDEPQLTCGKFCGVNFETQEAECKDAPLSEPGWKKCWIEPDPDDGLPVCKVGKERESCQIA
jgi:hypothetical protein